jgi:hypothetical protein
MKPPCRFTARLSAVLVTLRDLRACECGHDRRHDDDRGSTTDLQRSLREAITAADGVPSASPRHDP